MRAAAQDGMARLSKRLGAMLGFELDGYVLVNLEAFRETVDLVGGVEFDVPQDMYYQDPTQNLHIDLKAGKQLLDGEKSHGACALPQRATRRRISSARRCSRNFCGRLQRRS